MEILPAYTITHLVRPREAAHHDGGHGLLPPLHPINFIFLTSTAPLLVFTAKREREEGVGWNDDM